MPFAIRVHQFGGPEVMQWEPLPVGDPGPREVRIRHTAIGLNFIDVYERTGLYPNQLPTGLGREAAGVVVAAGREVTGLREGDRVGYVSSAVTAGDLMSDLPTASDATPIDPLVERALVESRSARAESLLEFARIPSISSLPEHAGDMVTAAEWVAERLRRLGCVQRIQQLDRFERIQQLEQLEQQLRLGAGHDQ